MAAIHRLIDRLLRDKFPGKDGIPDAISTWKYLQDEKRLPNANCICIGLGEYGLWTAQISVYSEFLQFHIIGTGAATRKKVAQQQAHKEALHYVQRRLLEKFGLDTRSQTELFAQSTPSSAGSTNGSSWSYNSSVGSSDTSSTSNDTCLEEITSEKITLGASSGSAEHSSPSYSEQDCAISSKSDLAPPPSGDNTCQQSERAGARDRRTIAIMQPAHTSAQRKQVVLAGEEYDKVEAMLVNAVKSHPPLAIFAVDIEKHDGKGCSEIMELGLDVLLPSIRSLTHHKHGLTAMKPRNHHHYIVKDHLSLENKYVGNDREGFSYGVSRMVPEAALLRKVAHLTQHDEDKYWIGHTLHQDIRWMEHRSMELVRGGQLDASVSFAGCNKIDIALVDRAIRSDYQSRKLSDIAAEYGVEITGPCHNGGNDAVITQECFLALLKKHFRFATEPWVGGMAAVCKHVV